MAGSHSPLTITSHKAGVVLEALRATAITRRQTAAERGRATGFDGTQGGTLHSCEAMGELIARAVGAHDVGQLHPTGPCVSGRPRGRRAHRLHRGRGRRRRREAEELNRRAVEQQPGAGDVEIPRRRLDRRVAEQALNRDQVDAHLQQMRREGVALMPRAA